MIYVYDDMTDSMVPKRDMLHRRANQEPSLRNPKLACPSIISDSMEPIQSMLDGKMYDSKGGLRKTYKEAGVVEVGNDPSILDPKPFKAPPPDEKKVKESLSRAYSQVNLTSNESPWEGNPTF